LCPSFREFPVCPASHPPRQGNGIGDIFDLSRDVHNFLDGGGIW
jgi:hypothetical protein